MKKILSLITFLSLISFVKAQQDSLPLKTGNTNILDTAKPASYKLKGKALTGMAGVYSLIHDSAQTATGELFLNSMLTAASNDFKLNTWVKVTNLKTKKSVLVRINDHLTSKMKKMRMLIYVTREAASKLSALKHNSFEIKVQSIVSTDIKSVDKNNLNTVVLKQDIALAIDTLTPNTFKAIGNAIMGIASFYSSNLDGTKTSTGETYRNSKLTAASNNFKLNTWVLVTNLKNKKSVIVRINDRMHPRMKRKGRVVDMSGEAARLLDYKEDGLVKVKVQPVIFFYSRAVKLELDSLQAVGDSSNHIDSAKADVVKNTEPTEITGTAGINNPNLDDIKTATGEKYRNSKLSAANNNFYLNTWVRVTNLTNNKSVVLRINDRLRSEMDEKGKVIYVSKAAAKKLGFIQNGVTEVKVEVVDKGTLE